MFIQLGDLLGVTATTVSIKRGGTIYVYNERGNINFTK